MSHSSNKALEQILACIAFTGKSIGEISAPEASSPTWQQQINSRQCLNKQPCEWSDSDGGLRSAAFNFITVIRSAGNIYPIRKSGLHVLYRKFVTMYEGDGARRQAWSCNYRAHDWPVHAYLLYLQKFVYVLCSM